MTEDFEKEASYLEENETIGEICTNLLVVKREILNYYDNEFESTPFLVQENKGPLLQKDTESRHLQPPPSSDLTNNENLQCKLLNCNKIILGSKPNIVSSNEDNFEKSGTIYQEKNDVSIDENYFEELVTSYEPSVVLQDIQSYLHKSKRFCGSCSILFPEPIGYENHLLIFHSENRSTGITHKKSLTEQRQHICTICAKQFVALHVLRRHLINIHKMNNAKALEMTTKETSAKIIEITTEDTHGKITENTTKETNATVFEVTTKYNSVNAKLVENTVMEASTPKITHESSDLSNTCFHCKKAFDTQKSLIEHLYDILQMKRKNTEIVPVLKSVLFKCNKCDIHFTSSQLAANHAEHMEMLINWKCSICNRIFKKEDELSHERQHSVSNNFLVYNLGDIDVTNILFRCSKCATHFTESNFLYHFRDCGLEDTKTVTCKICNILLDYNLNTLHEFDKHTESKPFTIIQCDVISDNPVKSTVNKSHTRDKLKELLKSFREVKIVLQKIDSNKMNTLAKSGKVKLYSKFESRGISEFSSPELASNEPPKVLQDSKASGKLWGMRPREKLSHGLNKNKLVNHRRLGRRNFTYSYCRSCKCFITKFRAAVHLQGRCHKLAKLACTCEHCGLILNKVSIKAHRRLHTERRDLKLTNFTFINLFNGRPMNPPTPDYPKCTHCEIHFLTKMARQSHICSKEAYQTCNICKTKLSETAFIFHMTFHQYATGRIKRVISNNLKAPTTLDVVNCVADENVTNIAENDKELPNNQRNVAEAKVTATRTRRNISRKYEMKGLNVFQAVNKKRHINIADLRRRNLTYYYCKTCKCFVTKFKKAAHVQGRCKNMTKIACTCEHCGLILNSGSIVTHRRLHMEKSDLKLENFRFFNLYNGRSMNPPIPDYPKCNHCAVHFLNEELRKNHICNAEAHQTCHLCDIELSEPAFELHMRFHHYKTDRITRITSKSSQSATNVGIEKCGADENVTKSIENNIESIHNPLDVAEKQLTVNTNQDYTINDNTRLDASLVENKRRLVNIADLLGRTRRNVTYSYCENCKCFITKFRKDAHIQGRCKKLAKIACTCEHCGLILNEASILTHKRLHEENKDLKLKNFKFFNLYTGRSMNPPIPEYPKCTHCAVHFLTETARNKHICSQQAYQACRLCDIKLSQAAFKYHMSFHQYATDRMKRVAMKNTQTATTLDIQKRVTDKNVTNSTENYIDTLHNPPDVTETELAANTSQEYKMNDNTKRDESLLSLVESKKIPVNIADHSSLRGRNVTYSYCETCKCFITKFRKDAHVQGRCKKLVKIACTCEYCGLILNDASIVTHRRLHEDKKDLKLKNFRFFNLYTGRPMNPPIPTYPKCNQCTVQFLTKRARNNHICSEQSYQMCHLCETKLSEAAFKLHMMFHEYPNERFKKATTVNSQSATLDNEKQLTYEKVNTTENDIEITSGPLDVAAIKETVIQKCINMGQKYKINNKRKIQAVNGKRLVYNADNLVLRRRNVTYSFCETCKCFITNFRKDAHVQGRCKNVAKMACTCEHCGLILNSASIMTHRRLHEERKDLKLKNFRFFNLYTGRSMNPPIPKYPKCTHCAVHFLTESARKDHVCSKEAHETCHLCEIKLSETAFKFHMKFHEYATDRMKRVVMKNSQSAITLDIEKRLTNEDVIKTTENKAELICNPLDVAESPVQNSPETYEIVYTCVNCSVSVDTYDKVVEHCQGHYNNENQEIKTNVCKYCDLTIDAECYTDHHNLHENGKQFNFLKYDSYYLPSDNNMWITHIFKTLPKEKVLDILRSSIYRFECRMKMEVIQQGDPNLTVYRCDQCSCFIEPGSLFKHSDNSCFKLRHHSCTVCGIPFNSSASRIDHEKIHNRPGITTDSYRIIVFNRERDKQLNRSFCLRKNYVLFQCRNCGVIIDKLQGDIHKCDVSNVKKCNHCALLLHSKDFEKHVNTHKEFVSFNYSNMKVILLGEDNFLKGRSENTLRSSFKGAIYDYKMFICNKCEICVKDMMCISKHICRFGKQRLKCLKCNLYFSVGRLKTHTRSHEQDPDFIRSNMNIISFDPCTFDQNKNTTVVYSKDSEFSDSNTDSDTEILAANDTNIANVAETIGMTPEIFEEETVKLYKCTCELHFLNEDSIIRHFGVCRSKAIISKQKCPKCDLLFTANVLFTHLLAHHRKKSFRYKYDVIEMDHIHNNMVQ